MMRMRKESKYMLKKNEIELRQSSNIISIKPIRNNSGVFNALYPTAFYELAI